MGADRALHVVTQDAVDSDAASRILEALIQQGAYSLVVMGKQSIDSDANQTGQLLASRLGWPQATFASKLTVTEDWASAEVTREVDGGLETLRVQLPAVVTTDLRLNEPRYPSLPGIVKAKKKPLDVVDLSSLGVDVTPKVTVVQMEVPAERPPGIKVESVEQLVDKLKNEAKVI
ncbi:MAG: electron transfer flavoprotein subunit beta/FixA family protein, partial [Bdellovibrionales bacterium]|nr:electron transfer flavoprotein subunit beta/FixA family protein [Bdellovibrionales bacterium]